MAKVSNLQLDRIKIAKNASRGLVHDSGQTAGSHPQVTVPNSSGLAVILMGTVTFDLFIPSEGPSGNPVFVRVWVNIDRTRDNKQIYHDYSVYAHSDNEDAVMKGGTIIDLSAITGNETYRMGVEIDQGAYLSVTSLDLYALYIKR